MNIHSYPFFRFTFFLIFGILFQFYLSIKIDFLWYALGITTSIYIIGYWQNQWKSFRYVIPMSCFLVGAILLHNHTDKKESLHFSHQHFSTYQAQISSPPIFKKTHATFEATIQQIKSENSWEKSTGKILISIKDKTSLQYGQTLLIHSTPQLIKKSTNPFQFDFQKYYSLQNISHQNFLSGHETIILKDANFSIVGFAQKIQQHFLTKFKTHLSLSEFSIISALLLGNKSHLDTSIKQQYAQAGVMHILAVSGLHVGILFLFFQFIFSKTPFLKSSKWLSTILLMICLWSYAFLTGLSPSILRASFMFSMLLISQVIQRHSNPYNTICFTAFVLLLMNSYYLFQVGFQLSFLAVFGILFFFEKIHSLIEIKHKLLDYFWKLMCISMACQLMVTPLSLFYFHQFPSFFLINNIFIIPLASGIVILGFIALVSSPLSFLFESLCWGLEKGISLLNWLVSRSQYFGHIEGIYLSIYELVLAYLSLLVISLFFKTKALKLYVLFVGFCLAFSGIQVKKYYQKTPSSISIYATKHSNIVLYENKQHILIGDQQLIQNQKKLATIFLPNWWNEGNQKQSFFSWQNQTTFQNLSKNYNLMVWKNKKIVIIKQSLTKNEMSYLKAISFDLMIIQHNSNLPNLTAKQTVLDGSNSISFCRKMHKKNPCVFCVPLQGFWQYQL